MDRRTFLKGSAVVATAAVAGIGATACNTGKGSKTALTPGIYQATATGAFGPVTANIGTDGEKITTCSVAYEAETLLAGSAACRRLAREVVDKQSIEVDTVSGATLSSMAFKNAIADALSQAGDISRFKKAPEIEPSGHTDEDCDVLIIGGGASGLSSAVSLIYNDFHFDKSKIKVILVEKQSILGGSGLFSQGNIAVGEGLELNEYEGYSSNADQMIKMLSDRSGEEASFINHDLATRYFDNAAETVRRFSGLGAPWPTRSSSGVMDVVGCRYAYSCPGDTVYPIDQNDVLHAYRADGGGAVTSYLINMVRNGGLDYRLDTAATELVVEKGAVVGAKVADKSTDYTIRAKKVLLCSGGFAQNKQMMREINPDFAGVRVACGGGSDGDGFKMTEGLGAVKVGKGCIAYLSPHSQFHGDLNVPSQKYPGLMLTAEGQRVMNEPKDFDANAWVKAVSNMTNSALYSFIDSTHPNAALCERLKNEGYVFTGDSVEEIADAMKIDGAAVAATIDAYNTDYKKGADDSVFGTPHDQMIPVLEPPFYAYPMYARAIGTMVGLKVNENFQPVTESGSVIPNLYALGEMSFGGNLLSNVYVGGMGIGSSVVGGRLVAEQIKAELL